jgi:transcription antitermination protein NusB
MTNPSLQKKSAARMAAVQCLYQKSVTKEPYTPAQQVEILKAQLKDNRDEQKMMVGGALEPNYTLVEKLLTGVTSEEQEINLRLDGTLKAEWKRERLSPLLAAILQCAIYEMFFGKEISAKIIIDEYTRLARRFFADKEVDFVHAALSKLAEQYG